MENEDFQEALKMFPTWDSSVWEPLQNKEYDLAEQNLESVLENIDMDDWSLVHWQGIFGGVPAVLGDISEEEWRAMVRPAIVKAIIGAASGKGLSNTLQELEPLEQLEFLNLFVKNVPGATGEEKTAWLKEKRPSLYMLATAAPAQELGINPVRYSGGLSMNTLTKKFKIIPKNLKDSLFSYENTEAIFRIGRNNHLSDEKISLMARLVGRVLMGFVHPEDFEKELGTTLLIDGRIVEPIAREIGNKVFYYALSDIRDVYEPVNLEKEASGDGRDVEIPISEFFSGAEENVPVTSSSPADKPFIIHEEKGAEPVLKEKSSILKSFSIPLGFFKQKSAAVQPGRPVKAEVEAPNQAPKNEKRVVHYSELRTSFSPFGESNFLNPSGNEPSRVDGTPNRPQATPVVPPPPEKPLSIGVKPVISDIPPIRTEPMIAPPIVREVDLTQKAEKPEILGTIKKTEPKVEGNVIDLKN
jgi:hypothetical protein